MLNIPPGKSPFSPSRTITAVEKKIKPLLHRSRGFLRRNLISSWVRYLFRVLVSTEGLVAGTAGFT